MNTRLHRLFLPCLLALAFLAPTATLRAVPGFPQAQSNLPADPAATFGTLPNGLRYVILPNHEPKGRVTLRLLVESGSFMEQNDQRGLAHFLEHMAFNGTTHYPAGTLIEFFQRMGMNFGGDTNAYTSFDHTVYMLDLPDDASAHVKEGLQVLADYAGGMLLQETQIDDERGVILSEKRTRDNVAYRIWKAEAAKVYAGTLIPERLPIGETAVIKDAKRPLFADLYNTWYRPERMVVVAVGDFDPAVMQTQITAAMSGLADRAPARPDPDLGHVASFQGVRVNYAPESEAASTTVSLQTVAPYKFEPDTAAKRLKDLPRDLAIAMLNRRLSILAKQADAPFSSAQASTGETFNFIHDAGIEVTCKPDQWQASIGVADHALRRALQYGFQPAELREAVAGYLNGLQQAVNSASTRQSSDLASQIISSLMDKDVFTTPAEDLRLLAPALAKVTPEDCAAALRAAWGDTGRFVLVSGNAVIPGDAHAAILAAYTAAHAEPVTPPAKLGDEKFTYTDFGPAGTVVSRREVKDLGITLVQFANGVRLNLKPTDFQADRINLTVRIGTGRLTEPRNEPGLAFTADNTFIPGGLGRLSADDLRRILAGHTVGVGFNVDGDALTLGGSTNRTDLLIELQLIAAHITDPGYRPEAMRQFHKGMDQMYQSFAHTPSGALNIKIPQLLSGDDPRFGLPAESSLRQRSLAEVKAWLDPQLARGAIEIGIVGDLNVDATIADVARTLGALPPRETRPDLAALRRVNIPAKPFDTTYDFTSVIPKGVVALFWHTADARDVHRTRRLSLLGDIFTDRLRIKVREQLGGAYSPSAQNSSSLTFDDYGWMRAFITVDPAKAQQIADVSVALANELAQHGVTADELERAKLPELTAIKQSERTNAYWLNAVLNRAQSMPEVLDWARSRTTDIHSVTAAQLDQLAKDYLNATQASRALILPQKPAEGTGE